MSLWDNVKKFAQPYADDDYDDYDDYDDEEGFDDYDEPKAPPRRSNPVRRSAPVSAPVEEDEDEDFGFAPMAAPASVNASSAGFNGHVVNMSSGAKQEVVLFRPTSFNDTTKAADSLRSRKAVVLNLENVDLTLSRRVVDFLTGCVYAVDGSVKKIANSAYIFCPHNMDVVGDLETLQAEAESYV